MTKLLYFDDSYLKEFDATIVAIHGTDVILDQTAFYPTGGGQPNDLGKLICKGKELIVQNVMKTDRGIVHQVPHLHEDISPNDKVHGVINWERRYKFMRMHTAAHVLSATVNKITGALVTGKQLDLDKSKIDFALEEFDKSAIQQFGDDASKTCEAGAPVKTYFMAREEVVKTPGMIRLAERMPPNVPELRIVEIKDVDIQPCGGTHVKDIKEIGKIKVLKAENKGKTNRRMYYTLE